MPDIVIIGGPNGAGKTTAARHLIPEALGIREFVNADEIARGLSPFNVDGVAMAAGRLMLQRIGALQRAGISFAFETTCAGRQHARWLANAKEAGWRITLLFLWLPNADIARARVRRRIAEGGHAIPPDVILRRFAAGLRNLHRLYLPLADFAAIYDSSEAMRLIAVKASGRMWIDDPERWAMIEEPR